MQDMHGNGPALSAIQISAEDKVRSTYYSRYMAERLYSPLGQLQFILTIRLDVCGERRRMSDVDASMVTLQPGYEIAVPRRHLNAVKWEAMLTVVSF